MWERDRLFRMFGAVVVAIGMTAGVIAIANAASDDDESGASLYDIASDASGEPGEVLPACPALDDAERLKSEGIPFGPCDPAPEEGPTVLTPTEEPEPSENCISIMAGKENFQIDLPCGQGSEVLETRPVDSDGGRLCVEVTYKKSEDAKEETETFCHDE